MILWSEGDFSRQLPCSLTALLWALHIPVPEGAGPPGLTAAQASPQAPHKGSWDNPVPASLSQGLLWHAPVPLDFFLCYQFLLVLPHSLPPEANPPHHRPAGQRHACTSQNGHSYSRAQPPGQPDPTQGEAQTSAFSTDRLPVAQTGSTFAALADNPSSSSRTGPVALILILDFEKWARCHFSQCSNSSICLPWRARNKSNFLKILFFKKGKPQRSGGMAKWWQTLPTLSLESLLRMQCKTRLTSSFFFFFCVFCAPTEECSKEHARTLVSSVYVTQVFSPLYARISLQSWIKLE